VFAGATSLLCLALVSDANAAGQGGWTAHVVMDKGHCNTAVALDANRDGRKDVIASYAGKVSLFLAPDWQREIILHALDSRHGCIHSTTLDVDRDGDLDWAGSLAHGHPFWLENPGGEKATAGRWVARPIDPDITGIHCLISTDVDRDGQQEVVINNFEPEKGLGDSMAWFDPPKDPRGAERWQRHVFADGDARGGSHYMGAGDVDGDGWSEIAVGAKGQPFADGNWFAFWKHPGGDGAGRAWEKVLLADQQIGATNILPADVNGDGRLDWLASRGHGRGLLWFENPQWKRHTIDDALQFPHSLAIADFDRDGDVDAASCGYGSERVMWYENDGRGRFTPHRIASGQQSYDLRAVDLDGDGDRDLLNAGRATGNVIWYENRLK
jgi:hypothetical protein